MSALPSSSDGDEFAVPCELVERLFAVAVVVAELFAEGVLREDGDRLSRLHALAVSTLDSVEFFDGDPPSSLPEGV